MEEGGLRLLPCTPTVALGALATFWLEIFDEVYAVDLALPVDHVVALELVNGAELLEGLKLIDAHLELPIVHILRVPVWDLVELK